MDHQIEIDALLAITEGQKIKKETEFPTTSVEEIQVQKGGSP